MKHDLEALITVLHHDGIILYPTDTVWGLGCDATNSKAVDKIIQLKGRAHRQSFIVLVHSKEQIEQYIRELPEMAHSLIELTTTPLTIIYPNARTALQHQGGLAPEVVAADGTVAIRVVQHPFCSALLQRFGKPIVSTSANFTGQPTPLTYADIDPDLRKEVDYTVNPTFEAPCTGKPSSIIKLEINGEVKILRL